MQKFEVLWLPFLAIVGFAGYYSCQRDAEQLTVKHLSDVPVDSRECGISTYCDCTITTDSNATLDLCGDMPQGTDNCTACGSATLGLPDSEFLEDEPRTFCVNKNGELCITNAGLLSVGVTVQFGSSTPINMSLSPNQTLCFHTNDDCETFNGCF
jgi:hypothetical protein